MKKMHAKVISVLLSVMMIFNLLPMAAFAEGSVAQPVAVVGETPYATLQEAVDAGGTVVLMKDITLNSLVNITKDVVIDGQGKYTVTGTAQKAFEVRANATFKDVAIVNTHAAGRCIDTRAGDLKVTLNNATLTTTGASNPQPLTIGGSGTNIQVEMVNSQIHAGDAGYAIITFNPVQLTATNCTLSGYCVVYAREANSSVGSAGSVFNFADCALVADNNSVNDPSNSFGALVLQDSNVTVNVTGTSTISAKSMNGPKQAVVLLNSYYNPSITGSKVNIGKDVTVTLPLAYHDIAATEYISVSANYTESLLADGFTVKYDSTCCAEGQVRVSGTYAPGTDYVAAVDGTPYATLQEAVDVGGNVTLLKNITLNSLVNITKDVVIDGQGQYTVTGTAKKTFEVRANATFKDVAIVNTYADGRCIDTRAGDLKVTLNNATLTTTGAANTQPLTIGGSGTNIQVEMVNSAIDAGSAGYAIITFNPVQLTATGSTLSGYAVVYAREANGSVGSAGSVFNFADCTLVADNNSPSGTASAFGALVLQDSNVTVNVTGNSTISAKQLNGSEQAVVVLNYEYNPSITGSKINIGKDVTVTLPVVYHDVAETEVIVVPATYADALNDTGFKTPVTENCGEGQVQILGAYDADHQHNQNKVVPGTEATCTTTGTTDALYCDVCEKLMVEASDVPAVDHTMTFTDAMDPSCTEAGNVAYYTCSVCGKFFANEDHTAEIIDVVIPATADMTYVPAIPNNCTDYGQKSHWMCNTCGMIFADEAHTTEFAGDLNIYPAGHSYRNEIEVAEGIKCDNCDYVKPAEGSHDSDDKGTQAGIHKDYQPELELTPEQEELVNNMTNDELDAASAVLDNLLIDIESNAYDNEAVLSFTDTNLDGSIGVTDEATLKTFNEQMMDKALVETGNEGMVIANNAEIRTEIYVDVQLKDVDFTIEIDPDTKELTAEIGVLSYEVKPKAKVFIDELLVNPEGTVIDNSMLKQAVIFRLPVPAAIGNNFKYVEVLHNGTNIGQMEIKKDATTGAYYVEVVTGSFSTFELVKFSNTQLQPIAPAPAAPTSPKTGDNVAALCAGLMALSVLGMATLSFKKRED